MRTRKNSEQKKKEVEEYNKNNNNTNEDIGHYVWFCISRPWADS